MKCRYKRKIENKISGTAAYRYIVGAVYAVVELLKKVLKAFLKHSIEILTAAAVVGAMIAANCFDSGMISYRAAVLFLAILFAMVAILIKIKTDKEDK